MATLQRLQMSRQEYDALPDRTRAEWLGGEVVVSPPPSFEHQRLSLRLTNRLAESLPGLTLVEAVGVQLTEDHLRIPDIVAVSDPPSGPIVTDPPVLVVEIVSPTTRKEDTVRKPIDYLTAGIEQYWLVDPHWVSIEVFSNHGDTWESIALVNADAPTAPVKVGTHGTVTLDLSLLSPSSP